MIVKKPGEAALYLQIATEIRESLLHYAYGEKIPSETELMEQYKVSRGTIRQAVECLANTGDIYKLHGRGMFRGGGTSTGGFLNAIPSMTSNVRRKGELPDISNVRLITLRANNQIAKHLSIPVGTEVWEMSRYRGTQNNKPHCYAVAYLPKDQFPHLHADDLKLSMLDMLTKDFGYVIGSTTNSLYAASADDKTSVLLDIPVGTAIFMSEFVARDENGQPFLFDITYTSNSAHYRYVIDSKYV